MTEIKVTVGSTKIVASVVQGMNGKTAYQSAVSGGYTGTEAQFNAILASIPTNASQLPFTPTGDISSTNVQNALAELDSEKASKAQEAWITATLLNGAVQSGTKPLQYRKTSIGTLQFRGEANSVPSAPTVFLTLPTGYRPSQQTVFTCAANQALARVRIETNGDMDIVLGSASGYLNLDSIEIPIS